ncbi:hypothetical protein ACPV5L_06940 [Vibrio astriarenae]
MQSQLPPGIEKLVRIEPQQLKSEQQLSQPSQSASHVPAKAGQQQLPHLNMPLAQWQVVRMLYAPQSMMKEAHYIPQQKISPTLNFPSERGVLTARFELEGQMQQVRWQVNNCEATIMVSTLANHQLFKLLPSVNGGWRIVVNSNDMAEPLQLLWNKNIGNKGSEGETKSTLNWFKLVAIVFFISIGVLIVIT